MISRDALHQACAPKAPNMEPINRERAIAGGFAGDVDVSKISRGGVRGEPGFFAIMAKLAEWETDLMHWRPTFAELGLFKTERSMT